MGPSHMMFQQRHPQLGHRGAHDSIHSLELMEAKTHLPVDHSVPVAKSSKPVVQAPLCSRLETSHLRGCYLTDSFSLPGGGTEVNEGFDPAAAEAPCSPQYHCWFWALTWFCHPLVPFSGRKA